MFKSMLEYRISFSEDSSPRPFCLVGKPKIGEKYIVELTIKEQKGFTELIDTGKASK